MNGVKVNATTLSCAVGGFVAGALAGWLVHKIYSSRHFDECLDAAVATVKDHYRERTILLESIVSAADLDGSSERVELGKSMVADQLAAAQPSLDDLMEEEINPEDITSSGGDEENGASLSVSTQELDDIQNRDISKPYGISVEEFCDPPEGRSQVTITYYASDQVLCDDKDEPIQNIGRTVGPLTPLDFGGISGDPHIRYVRNDKLDLDFEIVFNSGSYADVVLNYGNPRNPAQDA
jgi:hypothetical protein